MSDPRIDEMNRVLSGLLFETPPPEWLVGMVEDYERTGTYRPENYLRVFGDITHGASVGPDEPLEEVLKRALAAKGVLVGPDESLEEVLKRVAAP
jgi:hypothetical protein